MLNARPKLWRLITSFILAPLMGVTFARVASLAVQNIPRGMLPSLDIILIDIPSSTIVGGYPIGFVIGIPVYLVLRGRVKPSLLNVVLAGMFVATVPVILSMLINPGRPAPFESSEEIFEGMMILALMASSGAMGGIVFWLCTVSRDPSFQDEVKYAPYS